MPGHQTMQVDIYAARIIEPRREPSSPVGPTWGDRVPMCTPCGHTWSDHDDQGCLWNSCQCLEPGERK